MVMVTSFTDPLNLISTMEVEGKTIYYFSLEKIENSGIAPISKLPYCIRILIESLLPYIDGIHITVDDIKNIVHVLSYSDHVEIPFMPKRVIMQDFTGVPALVDLAAMRDALAARGGDPNLVNPHIPVDLIIDHSIQVDNYGSIRSLQFNTTKEFERNRERYEFLKWGAHSFDNFSVIPPSMGIIHQINLEKLAKIVHENVIDGKNYAMYDTLVGTDSHTTMINGLGILGWGVGGIEAEAALLGTPISTSLSDVIGVELKGQLLEGVTATDLVLTITKFLRDYGVVGKFIEFFGSGVRQLSLPDRATISNMCPEYGATVAFFPVDEITISYLKLTGRNSSHIALVEAYTKHQRLFRSEESLTPSYTDIIHFNLEAVEPTIAGPKRPYDSIPLHSARSNFTSMLKKIIHTTEEINASGSPLKKNRNSIQKSKKQPVNPLTTNPPLSVEISIGNIRSTISHGAVVIAAITSCTNTSNPSLIIGAGICAKKAVEYGLHVPPWVKTSFAPGSRVVAKYLVKSNLINPLQALGFHIVGYGCTTCIGNSGKLNPEVERVIIEHDLYVTSVLSGNRNFEGRIHPLVKGNYLASPPLVVAYAIAGTMNIDLLNDPLGYDPNGNPVWLRDIWPTEEEIESIITNVLDKDIFIEEYGKIFEGNELWNNISVTHTLKYPWSKNSTYIRKPPFFKSLDPELKSSEPRPINNARVLALLGDTITTDHISPAGSIPPGSPAAQWLDSKGVSPAEYNTYGSRRGNHEVMVRGTFANVRLKNLLVPGIEGGYTIHFPSGDKMTIFDAARRYASESSPLIVIAGKEYGTGSSRDWAAKGTLLLGVKAVLAKGFERIHRSNLIDMGVLPLQFIEGEDAHWLGIHGDEKFFIPAPTKPFQKLRIEVQRANGSSFSFYMYARIDNGVELEYYKHGGILRYALQRLIDIKATDT